MHSLGVLFLESPIIGRIDSKQHLHTLLSTGLAQKQSVLTQVLTLLTSSRQRRFGVEERSQATHVYCAYFFYVYPCNMLSTKT